MRVACLNEGRWEVVDFGKRYVVVRRKGRLRVYSGFDRPVHASSAAGKKIIAAVEQSEANVQRLLGGS